jgi:hypothetical protein
MKKWIPVIFIFITTCACAKAPPSILPRLKENASEEEMRSYIDKLTSYLNPIITDIYNRIDDEERTLTINKIENDITRIYNKPPVPDRIGDVVVNNNNLYASGIKFEGNGTLGTDDFVIGVTGQGWQITGEGDAHLNNAYIRGIIRSAVFQKDVISSVGGNLLVANSDILAEDMTALDSSDLTIEGNSTFSVGDKLRIKDGTDDEWMNVINISSAPTYGVERDTATQYTSDDNPAWQKGVTVVSYGGTGDGVVYLTASETNAPYISILTSTAVPWTTLTEKVRIGLLTGVDSDVFTPTGYGIWTDNGYFEGTVNITDGSSLEYATAQSRKYALSCAKMVGSTYTVIYSQFSGDEPELQLHPSNKNIEPLDLPNGCTITDLDVWLRSETSLVSTGEREVYEWAIIKEELNESSAIIKDSGTITTDGTSLWITDSNMGITINYDEGNNVGNYFFSVDIDTTTNIHYRGGAIIYTVIEPLP